MAKLTELTSMLPQMLSGKELMGKMASYPPYDHSLRKTNKTERLIALSDLYNVYVPSAMSVEIYSKIYLALVRSLNKKSSSLAIRQFNENRKAVLQREYRGLMGGSDSFTIIGESGSGKSSAVSRTVSLIGGQEVITIDEPMMMVIPCVVVQCPFDASVKGMLLEILRTVDELLETRYYDCAVRARATTDMLIGSVSQVALNHIGLLIVDEIQHVANSKNGKILIGALTQLINNSGISVCMIGTPESAVFFEQAMQLARRSLGLTYGRTEYDEQFEYLCEKLLTYQYVRKPFDMKETPVSDWLYEHSRGLPALVVSLIHDAQEIAILNGREVLDMAAFEEAYQRRLSLMHDYIEVQPKKTTRRKKPTDLTQSTLLGEDPEGRGEDSGLDDISISGCVMEAKRTGKDILEILRDYITIEEVTV